MAKDNKQIGLFNLDGIAPARRGVPQIAVKFDIDANGILSVSAIDKATGKEQHITIENKHTLTQEEIDRIKHEAEEHAAEDAKTKERLDKQNKIDSTIYQVEKTLEDFKDKSDILTEEDKTYFNSKIDELKTLRDGDLNNVDNVLNEVTNRLMSVGSKAYGGQNSQQGNPFGQGFFGGNFDASQFADMFGGKNGPFNGATNNGTTTNTKTEDVEEV